MSTQRLLLVTILFVIWIVPVNTAAYTIQIGAYAKPEFAETTRAQAVGDMTHQLGDDGLTRIYIGHYTALPDAQAALIQLRAAGYPDAFISSGISHASNDPMPTVASKVVNDVSGDIEQRRYNAAKAKLPPDQHANIVVLDGRLMLRDGENFRPIH